jgi:hypothetical protein
MDTKATAAGNLASIRPSFIVKDRGASFVKRLSFVDQGLWGFVIADADGYSPVFYQLRNE